MARFDADYLKTLPIFSQISKEHLQWLLSVAEVRELQAGELLFDKGEPIYHMYLVLEGQLDQSLVTNGQQRVVLNVKKGEVTGLLPFSRLKVTGGRSVAHVPTSLLCLHQRHFPEMEQVSQEMTQQLVALMTDRVREFTRSEQQQEKLLALGKLSAGLAHELNNPASVIVRSSTELLRMNHTVPDKFKRILTMRITPAQVDEINDVLFSKIEDGLQSNLSMLERSSLEEELIDWMEDKGVEDSYKLAETFVASGLQLADLDKISAILKGKYLAEVLEWLSNTLETERVICDIQAASKRISELVNAVKAYSHMDRGQEKEKTNILGGIKSTLTMLTHKLKEKKIRVEQHFPPDLPAVHAYVGELNQVWTNLIDNAIDAMPEGGTLTISAGQENEYLAVRIADNGSGIPPEAMPHIFEPFYTTKPIGHGTGLGLDIVHKIVMHHGATIKVNSKPGETVFELCFSLD